MKDEETVFESEDSVAAAIIFYHLVARRGEQFTHVRFAMAANFTSRTSVTVHVGAGMGDKEYFERECEEARAFAHGYVQCMTDVAPIASRKR